MARIRSWPRLAFPFLAGVVALPAVARADPPAGGGPRKVDAPALARDLVRATAFTAKSARQVPTLDPKALHAKPFWTELGRMEKVAGTISKGLAAHDPKVFREIAEGGETAAGLKVAWHRTGVSDAKVKEGIEVLAHALATLRTHYGEEALRRKRGGELTDAERKSLTALKAKDEALAVRWRALREAAAAKGHKRVVAELDHLLAEAERVAKSPATVDGWLRDVVHVETMEGEWRAYSYHVPADLRETWHETTVVAEATFVEFDASVAEEADSVAVADWAYLDEDVEVPAALDLDVEIADEEVGAQDAFLEEEVHETSAEEYEHEAEEAHDAEPEEADDSAEFGDSADDGGD